MTLQVPVVVLIAMSVAVAILATYRKFLVNHEDDSLHFDEAAIAQQRGMARSLRRIDRLGISLTVVTALYGLLLLGMAMYRGLVENGTIR